MAEIQPNGPQPPEPEDAPAQPQPIGDEWIGDPELEAETRALIAMLKYEIGVRWMSIELRFQIEKVEELLGESGTVPVGF
jgi:hypothetical protein